jgi:hypothetical protein
MHLVKNPFMYFGLTLLYSWVFWIAAILIGTDLNDSLVQIFYYIGGIGPSLVGILLTYIIEEQDYIKDFWKRSYQFRLIKPKWYLYMVLFVLIPIFIKYYLKTDVFSGLPKLLFSGVILARMLFILPKTNPIILIVGTIASIAVYAILLYYTGYLNQEDINILKNSRTPS